MNTTEIAAFKTKMDNARGKGENMYVPKGAVVPELVTTAQNASLNPLPWIENLNRYFFQAIGVPAIILGSSSELTEASAKIAYLAFQQVIEEEQLFVEEQVLLQLNLEIELTFPADLTGEALSDGKARITRVSACELRICRTTIQGCGRARADGSCGR